MLQIKGFNNIIIILSCGIIWYDYCINAKFMSVIYSKLKFIRNRGEVFVNKGEKNLKSFLFVVLNIIDIYFILMSVFIWSSPVYTFSKYKIENPVFIAPFLVFLYIALALAVVVLRKQFPIS